MNACCAAIVFSLLTHSCSAWITLPASPSSWTNQYGRPPLVDFDTNPTRQRSIRKRPPLVAFDKKPTRRRTMGAPTQLSMASVSIDTELTDDKVTALFAWVSRAMAGDDEYNNLMLALATIFGDLDERSPTGKIAQQMKRDALDWFQNETSPTNATRPEDASNSTTLSSLGEEMLRGEAFPTDDREIASLGAMGAAQWTGQFQTRPHALLSVKNLTSVENWTSTLPRGCKRTIKRALAGNFTVSHRPIVGNQPAPHSALAHFRCVIAHEVRLLTFNEYDVEGFLNALAEGVSRYMGTTRMAGDIYEYRDLNGKVIAIAHEVRKGEVLRGQWFYANDYASQNYVWFHSVYRCVERAIESNNERRAGKKKNAIQVVDLGPSGSDSFSLLKSKYGFVSVADWTKVADYTGPFYYNGSPTRPPDGTNAPARYEQQLQAQAMLRKLF